MSEASRPRTENQILGALPPEDRERIAAHLEPVELPHGHVIYHVDQQMEHVYFPTNSMVSLVSQLSDGTSIEVGVTGFEGMVGLPVMLGVDRSPHECITQINDGAMRAKADSIRSEFKRGGALQDLLLRYSQSLMLTVSQVAACNRVHTVGERLARWLLMSYDRCPISELPLTQDFLAIMLGTRRAGVTEAAVILQAEGVINYRRGRITMTDREGLEETACECYKIIKAEFDRLPGQ